MVMKLYMIQVKTLDLKGNKNLNTCSNRARTFDIFLFIDLSSSVGYKRKYFQYHKDIRGVHDGWHN